VQPAATTSMRQSIAIIHRFTQIAPEICFAGLDEGTDGKVSPPIAAGWPQWIEEAGMHILKTLRAIFAGMFLLVMISGLLAACKESKEIKESKEEAAKPEYKPGIAAEMANGIVSSRSLERPWKKWGKC